MGDRVYHFPMDTLDPKYLLEMLVVVFDSLNCAAKLNIAFGSVHAEKRRRRELLVIFCT